MSKYESFVEHINEMSKLTVDAFRKAAAEMLNAKLAILDTMEADMEEYKRTGVLPSTLVIGANNNETTTEEAITEEATMEEATKPRRRGRPQQKTNPAGRSSSLKENLRESSPDRSPATGRRNACMEASQLINNNTTVSGTVKNVMAKIEKLTEEFFEKNSEIANVPIKQERMDMPPPTQVPMRQTRKRKVAGITDAPNSDVGSVQVKEELINTEPKKRKARPVSAKKPSIVSRDSDVLISAQPVETINLVETDEEYTGKPIKAKGRPRTKQKIQKSETTSSGSEDKSVVEDAPSVRVTRTKTKNSGKNKDTEIEQDSTKEKQKRARNSSSEVDDKPQKKIGKRTKAKKNEDSDAGNSKTILNRTEAENEQVEPQPSAVMNETFVASKPTALNTTVVITKSKNTDDKVVSPVKAQKSRKVEQVFSPYENSPVKKRVEAFEKLGAEISPRMTRTKTKVKKQAEKEDVNGDLEPAPENIPNNAKYGAIPKLRSTPQHSVTITKMKISQSGPLSGLKISQAEFRERELRHKQKETEALAKKEALIQAQTEERRRKREERQLKAQQMREALEKDKQKTQESAERQKREKSKQMQAEKEEKLLRCREEAARKRALVLKKAAEEKEKHRQEEKHKLEEKFKLEEKYKQAERKRLEEAMSRNKNEMKIPPYLKYEAPFLPTEDCYDSDDSNAKNTYSQPHWQKKADLLKTLTCTRYINIQQQQLFCNRRKTVDLKEIFPSIEPSKLKRTSSAIWNKSGLSTLPLMDEEDEYLTA